MREKVGRRDIAPLPYLSDLTDKYTDVINKLYSCVAERFFSFFVIVSLVEITQFKAIDGLQFYPLKVCNCKKRHLVTLQAKAY